MCLKRDYTLRSQPLYIWGRRFECPKCHEIGEYSLWSCLEDFKYKRYTQMWEEPEYVCQNPACGEVTEFRNKYMKFSREDMSTLELMIDTGGSDSEYEQIGEHGMKSKL